MKSNYPYHDRHVSSPPKSASLEKINVDKQITLSSFSKNNPRIEPSNSNFSDRSINGAINALGIVQVVTGVSVAATLLLSSGCMKAVAQNLTSAQPTQPQTLAQTPAPAASNLLFVNPTVGNDSGNGSQGAPFRTISHALQVAPPSTVILLAPGTYSEETGESFPLTLKPGVMIQGDPSNQGEGIVIRGGGAFLSPTFAQQNITMLGANQSGVTGVTLTNPNPRGYALWIESSNPSVVSNTFTGSAHDGISVTGNSAPLIQSNAFVQNGANGITIYGTSQPQLRDNVFERTGFGINISQNAAPVITGNRIANNRDGIVVQGSARPVLRNNTIENNQQDGIVAIAQSLPNLGTAAEPGNNTFSGNGRYDVNASATNQMVVASGNGLVSDRTTGRVDLAGNAPTASVAATPVAQPTTPARAIANPPTLSVSTLPPARVAPSAVTSAPMAAPSTTASSATTSTPRGFSSIPSLQPAPLVTPASQGAVPQPTRPERLPLVPQPRPSTSNSASAAGFPSPTALNQASASNSSSTNSARRPTTTRQPSTSEETAIEIPVPAPASRSGQSAARNTPASSAPIEIPVQPPAQTAARPSSSLREVTVRRSEQPAPAMSIQTNRPASTAIEIPVPAPESTVAAAPAPSNRALTSAPRATPPVPQSNLLPVPGGDVPLGHIGDMPTVLVSRDPLRRSAGSPPPVPTRASVTGLRYRVVVEADDEGMQSLVRSLIPGAFRTYANGRVMMQAGAYSDRTNADEAARMLTTNGLRATVQQVE